LDGEKPVSDRKTHACLPEKKKTRPAGACMQKGKGGGESNVRSKEKKIVHISRKFR
jgi:hypothetical protein